MDIVKSRSSKDLRSNERLLMEIENIKKGQEVMKHMLEVLLSQSNIYNFTDTARDDTEAHPNPNPNQEGFQRITFSFPSSNSSKAKDNSESQEVVYSVNSEMEDKDLHQFYNSNSDSEKVGELSKTFLKNFLVIRYLIDKIDSCPRIHCGYKGFLDFDTFSALEKKILVNLRVISSVYLSASCLPEDGGENSLQRIQINNYSQKRLFCLPFLLEKKNRKLLDSIKRMVNSEEELAKFNTRVELGYRTLDYLGFIYTSFEHNMTGSLLLEFMHSQEFKDNEFYSLDVDFEELLESNTNLFSMLFLEIQKEEKYQELARMLNQIDDIKNIMDICVFRDDEEVFLKGSFHNMFAGCNSNVFTGITELIERERERGKEVKIVETYTECFIKEKYDLKFKANEEAFKKLRDAKEELGCYNSPPYAINI